MESISSFKLGHVGQKTRSLGKILEGAVLIQTYETVDLGGIWVMSDQNLDR